MIKFSWNCMQLSGNIDMQVIVINEWGKFDQWMSLSGNCMQLSGYAGDCYQLIE